jgi:hypothetical protein
MVLLLLQLGGAVRRTVSVHHQVDHLQGGAQGGLSDRAHTTNSSGQPGRCELLLVMVVVPPAALSLG